MISLLQQISTCERKGSLNESLSERRIRFRVHVAFFDQRFYTCDKQVLWESVGVFFRATSPTSARNSHSLGVRGLVVRCLLFNPEGSCPNRCVCSIFTSIPKQKVSTFFGTMKLPPFSALWDFFENFFNVPKGSSLHFFDIFATERMLKIPKNQTFRRYETLQNSHFLFFFRNFCKVSKVSLQFLVSAS